MENKTIGGKREKLSSVLPLKMPFLIQIFPVYACNFKCEFCIYSLDKSKHTFLSDCVNMEFSLFEKFISDFKQVPEKIKMLRFAGTGEPLLHKNIAKMVKIAKQADFADKVDLVTNGVLLTHKLSDDLISAGLDTLRISVNGLNTHEFKKHCDVNLNFNDFISNIKYFYDNKKDTQVYIKILDYMINTQEKKDLFYNIFSPICDIISVENLVEPIDTVDVSKLGGSFDKTQNGQDLLDVKVCPQPFYMLQLNPDGKIVPCCSMEYPVILGDVNYENAINIFTGSKFNQFRLNLLENNKNTVCAKCQVYKYGIYQEDVLDNDIDRLKDLY